MIWLAGLVFLLGSVITLWPDAREEQRLAIRYGRLTRAPEPSLSVLTAALVIGALLAVAAVWFVARPFLGREPDVLPAEPPPERLALEEERDRALGALKDLEFDHRTGKISDDDYRGLVGDLRRDAAEALKALDRGTPRADARVPD